MLFVRTCTSGKTGICSYIILDNTQHFAQSYFIGIPQDEFLSDHTKEETKEFMTSLESLIEKYREGVFHTTSPSLIYYDAFEKSPDTDENGIPYGDELIDDKS